MVLTKRFGYGFDGYQVPTTPQGSRQFRKKRSARKRVQGDPMCSFELLATVAGRVLLEKETECSKNSVKEEQQDELKFHKAESRNQGDCCTRTDVHENGFQRIIMASRSKECLHSSATVGIHPRSIVIKSNPSKKVGSAEKPKFNRSTTKFVKSPSPDQEKISCKEQGKVANGVSTLLQLEPKRTTNGNRGVVGMQLQEDPMEVDAMPALLRSVEAPVHADSISRASSSPKCETDKEFSVGSRNDGKSPRINNPYNSTSKYLRGQHIGDRRIRKFMGTKLLKVGPTYKNEREFHNLDEDVKSVLYSRKICYMRRRTQRSICKRRKLFERGTVMTSDAPINYEDICPSPQMNITKEKASSSLPRACEGGGTSTSSAVQRISFQSDDYPVKFSIKSFKVPELVIEIPETATVGSLRRTVMEAVSAIIGGGLRVGVVLQGKKVRDDNKTLLQAGISKSVELDGLGFTLEPNPLEATQQQATKTEDGPFLSSCDAPELLKRFPANPSIDPAIGETEIPNRPPPPTMSASGVEGEQQADHSPPASTAPMANNTPSSKALVAHPATNAEALAIVPRTTRSNAAQRRIRRPFSVPEVEALVQAVEKLGTGRWRDVKLRSFDDANHRTYVDLKDKWKTLVHTARISPQRRRGEPVPQELLERVLSAHAYWTQQQVESQQLEPWLLLDGGSPRLAPSPPYLSDETR